MSQITNVVNPANKAKIAPGTSGLVNGVTITNSSTSKWVYVFRPGRYTSSIIIPAPGDNLNNSVYVFLNGIYYLTSGANMAITAGYVSNTSNGLPHFVGSPSIGATDLPPASDGTNGVEFIFDQGGTFSANNSDLPNDGSVFFVAPHFARPAAPTSPSISAARTATTASCGMRHSMPALRTFHGSRCGGRSLTLIPRDP